MFSAVRFYSDMLRPKSLFNTKALSQIPFIHVKIPKDNVCVRMYVCMYVCTVKYIILFCDKIVDIYRKHSVY